MGKQVLKAIKLSLLGLLGVILLLIIAGVLFREYRQHQLVKVMAVNAPNGINEAAFVRIGGIDQWMGIRGRDVHNPILLVLHGGPGATTGPLAPRFLSWERDFTLVQWDQRGAGKTFGRSGPLGLGVTIARMAQDGVEVTEFLRRRLHKEKVLLVGWSWGSILGVEMAKARPDLFYAYIGTGQIVNVRKNYAFGYARLLDEARSRGDRQAAQDLEAIGPPPHNSIRKLGVHTRQALAYEAGAPSTLQTLSAIL